MYTLKCPTRRQSIKEEGDILPISVLLRSSSFATHSPLALLDGIPDFSTIPTSRKIDIPTVPHVPATAANSTPVNTVLGQQFNFPVNPYDLYDPAPIDIYEISQPFLDLSAHDVNGSIFGYMDPSAIPGSEVPDFQALASPYPFAPIPSDYSFGQPSA